MPDFLLLTFCRRFFSYFLLSSRSIIVVDEASLKMKPVNICHAEQSEASLNLFQDSSRSFRMT